jgi:hypothetical protein
MKTLIAFLALLPTLALADLGDSRLSQRNHYPGDWVVTHVYNKKGIAVVADYAKRSGYFTDQEVTQILQRNGMPTEVWMYYPGRDGTLTNEDARADGSDPRQGQTLSFHRGDLGVKSVTVGTSEGFKLAPRGFISRPNGYR